MRSSPPTERHDGSALACTTEQTLLGEGARRDELLRVDILAGRVHRNRVTDDGGSHFLSWPACPLREPFDTDPIELPVAGWVANRGISFLR